MTTAIRLLFLYLLILMAKNSNLVPTERKLQNSQLSSDPQREKKS
jgi:hypothetical protein